MDFSLSEQEEAVAELSSLLGDLSIPERHKHLELSLGGATAQLLRIGDALAAGTA